MCSRVTKQPMSESDHYRCGGGHGMAPSLENLPTQSVSEFNQPGHFLLCAKLAQAPRWCSPAGRRKRLFVTPITSFV
jgi:hypothetical protein